MKDLIDALLSNPLILIFIGIAVLQALGSLGAKAARRAIEQQKRAQRQAQRQEQQGSIRPAAAAPQPQAPRPQATRRRATPDPDEIAAEIRRMMGMEEPPRAEPVIVIEEAPQPAPRRVALEQVGVLDAPQGASSRSAVAALAPAAKRMVARPARRRRERLLDIRDPVAAFVAMEVLGRPRALRSWDKL